MMYVAVELACQVVTPIAPKHANLVATPTARLGKSAVMLHAAYVHPWVGFARPKFAKANKSRTGAAAV